MKMQVTRSGTQERAPLHLQVHDTRNAPSYPCRENVTSEASHSFRAKQNKTKSTAEQPAVKRTPSGLPLNNWLRKKLLTEVTCNEDKPSTQHCANWCHLCLQGLIFKPSVFARRSIAGRVAEQPGRTGEATHRPRLSQDRRANATAVAAERAACTDLGNDKMRSAQTLENMRLNPPLLCSEESGGPFGQWCLQANIFCDSCKHALLCRSKWEALVSPTPAHVSSVWHRDQMPTNALILQTGTGLLWW